ncbi:MAG: hypothetical protein SGI88_09485 [Candidatus Hydrogenedentes bacterium]|nr:hypothetical protein [Candidatus Hydrogenedentota bacterium]
MKVIACVRLALAGLCVMTATAFADPEQRPKPDTPQYEENSRRERSDSNSMSDEEIREFVSTIMMVRISRDLKLNDEQTVLLVRHLQEMRDEMHTLFRERDHVFKEMKELAGKPEATDAELTGKLGELRLLDEKRSQAKSDVFDRASEKMTVRQKAKLYVTLQEFEWQMRRLVQRVKEMSDDELKKMRDEWGRDMGEGNKDPVKQLLKSRDEETGPGKPAPDKPKPE